jgi:hypothetical protein
MVHSFKVAIQCGIWWFTTIFNPYSPMDIKLVLWFLGHPTIGDSEPMFSLIYNHILEVYPIFRHTKWVDSDPFSGFWLCFFPKALAFWSKSETLFKRVRMAWWVYTSRNRRHGTLQRTGRRVGEKCRWPGDANGWCAMVKQLNRWYFSWNSVILNMNKYDS